MKIATDGIMFALLFGMVIAALVLSVISFIRTKSIRDWDNFKGNFSKGQHGVEKIKIDDRFHLAASKYHAAHHKVEFKESFEDGDHITLTIRGRNNFTGKNTTFLKSHMDEESFEFFVETDKDIGVDPTNALGYTSIDTNVINNGTEDVPCVLLAAGAADLRYVVATDANGTTWDYQNIVRISPSSGAVTPLYSDQARAKLLVIDNHPIVVWSNSATTDLVFYSRGKDHTFQVIEDFESIATDGTVTNTSTDRLFDAMVVDNRPAILYVDADDPVYWIGNAMSSGEFPATAFTNDTSHRFELDSLTMATGDSLSLAMVNGNPAALWSGASNDLYYERSSNATGTSWGGTTVTIKNGVLSAAQDNYVGNLAILLGDPLDTPHILYAKDTTIPHLFLMKANDENGATWTSASTNEVAVNNVKLNDVDHLTSYATATPNNVDAVATTDPVTGKNYILLTYHVNQIATIPQFNISVGRRVYHPIEEGSLHKAQDYRNGGYLLPTPYAYTYVTLFSVPNNNQFSRVLFGYANSQASYVRPPSKTHDLNAESYSELGVHVDDTWELHWDAAVSVDHPDNKY